MSYSEFALYFLWQSRQGKLMLRKSLWQRSHVEECCVIVIKSATSKTDKRVIHLYKVDEETDSLLHSEQ